MPKAQKEIIQDIVDHINKRGGRFSDWYVGIATSPRDRVFTDHKVKEMGDAWIYRKAMNHTDARSVERYMIDTYSTKGGPGGGSDTTVCVYAYKISRTTNESVDPTW